MYGRTICRQYFQQDVCATHRSLLMRLPPPFAPHRSFSGAHPHLSAVGDDVARKLVNSLTFSGVVSRSRTCLSPKRHVDHRSLRSSPSVIQSTKKSTVKRKVTKKNAHRTSLLTAAKKRFRRTPPRRPSNKKMPVTASRKGKLESKSSKLNTSSSLRPSVPATESTTLLRKLDHSPKLCRKLVRFIKARKGKRNAVLAPVPVAVEHWLQQKGFVVNAEGHAAEVAPNHERDTVSRSPHTLTEGSDAPLHTDTEVGDVSAAMTETEVLYDRAALQENDARIAMRSLMAQYYRVHHRPFSEEQLLRKKKLHELFLPYQSRRDTQALNAEALEKLPVEAFLPPVDTHQPPAPEACNVTTSQQQFTIDRAYSDACDRRVDPMPLHVSSDDSEREFGEQDPLLSMLHDGAVSLSPPPPSQESYQWSAAAAPTKSSEPSPWDPSNEMNDDENDAASSMSRRGRKNT